jgi:hypothetical protein
LNPRHSVPKTDALSAELQPPLQQFAPNDLALIVNYRVYFDEK